MKTQSIPDGRQNVREQNELRGTTNLHVGPESRGRLVSLDVFRGITIAGMILVNNPGSGHVYWPLEHAQWRGWTPTDLIFPFFLFIVGISITLALSRRVGIGGRHAGLLVKISQTPLLLFLFLLILYCFPLFSLSVVPHPGVLPPI